jgi:mRNA interferase MazF
MIQRGRPRDAVVAGRRPHAVIQSNAFSLSGVSTVLVVPITSSVSRMEMPGNVALETGEGGLREQSVANVSQVTVVDRRRLRRPMGQLSEHRVREIIAGLNLLLTPRG